MEPYYGLRRERDALSMLARWVTAWKAAKPSKTGYAASVLALQQSGITKIVERRQLPAD